MCVLSVLDSSVLDSSVGNGTAFVIRTGLQLKPVRGPATGLGSAEARHGIVGWIDGSGALAHARAACINRNSVGVLCLTYPRKSSQRYAGFSSAEERGGAASSSTLSSHNERAVLTRFSASDRAGCFESCTFGRRATATEFCSNLDALRPCCVVPACAARRPCS
jgi:hypothetical protein